MARLCHAPSSTYITLLKKRKRANEQSAKQVLADIRQVAPDNQVADAVQGAQLLQRFVGKNPLGASRHYLYGHARAQGDADPAHGATARTRHR